MMKKLVMIGLIALLVCSLATVVTARTKIVKLCEKDTTTWECQKGIKEHVDRKPIFFYTGSVRYKDQGDTLNIFLNTNALDKEQVYQVALVGKGGTVTDDLLATACAAPNQGPIWECGYWGNQGFYNFHIGQLGSKRNNRYVMHDLFDVVLPSGNYEDVQFLVKQNSAPWDIYLFETQTLDFTIA